MGRPQPGSGGCDIGAYEFAPLTCAALTAATTKRTPVAIRLDCRDPAAAPVNYAIGSSPSHGSVSAFDAATGRLTYTPANGYIGPDTLTYTASNGNGSTGSAIVKITVNPTSSPPPPVVPAIRRLHITPGTFADRLPRDHRRTHRRTGTTVSYTDQAAFTTFSVLARRAGIMRGGRCTAPSGRHRGHPKRRTRAVTLGSLHRHDRAGRNRFRFSGVVGGKPLAPGRFQLQAVPALGRARGAAAAVGL